MTYQTDSKQKELEVAKSQLKALDVIGYDCYGFSGIEAVNSTIISLKKYDEIHPPEQEIEYIKKAQKRREG